MKKSLLAVAVLSAVSFGAYADGVTLYGVVDAGVAVVSNVSSTAAAGTTGTTNAGSVTGMQNGGMQTPRWGIKGVEDLGDGMSAKFVLENEFLVSNGISNSSTTFFKRASWVGLEQKELGEIRLGHQNSAMYDYLGKYDAMQGGNIGGNLSTKDYTVATSNSGNVFKGFAVDRYDNAVEVLSSDMNGLKLRAAYAFGNTAGNNNQSSAYDIGGEFQKGNLQVGAAYQAAYASASGYKATTNFGLFALYDFGVAKVNASHTSVKGELTGGIRYEMNTVGVRVPVASKTTLIGQFIYTNNEQITATSHTVSGGIQYDFSKRTAVYLLGSQTSNDAAGAVSTLNDSKFIVATGSSGLGKGAAPAVGASQSAFMLGINHKF